MTNKTSLIVDANNILYRTFFAQIDEKESELIGMAHHSALCTIQKYWKLFPTDEIVMAFDSGSWRKQYTSDLSYCVTHKKYKGTRRQNLTAKQSAKLERFDEHITAFADMIETQTSLLTLKTPNLEADDLIAGYVQTHPDMHHIILSSDKDYMQLLVKHNVTLIDPASGKPRSLSEEYMNDPNYFIFSKCIRGDTSDNVMSASPNIRQSKILKAYTDEYTKQEVMQRNFTVLVNEGSEIVEKTFNTAEVFDENDFLMNLESQPECIRELIVSSIENAKNNRGKYNYIKFLRFCGKYELQNIINQIDKFTPMLAGKRSSN